MIDLSTIAFQDSRGSTIEHPQLSTLQRILLGCDGTMTNLLEEIFKEDLRANKIFEKISLCAADVPELSIRRGQPIWRRIVTLQGRRSGIDYLYADSMIAPDHLDSAFANRLLHTNVPIGKIWELFRVETYKNLVRWGEESAGDICEYFKIARESPLLCRTYRVFSQKRPIMQVTEKFPRSWFQDAVMPSIPELRAADGRLLSRSP